MFGFGNSKSNSTSNPKADNWIYLENKYKYQPFNSKSRIGSGAFADVFRGFNIENNQPVAIKRVDLTKKISKKLHSRLKDEAEIMFQVDHEYVIKLFDTYTEENYYYMVMEFCAGGDLDHYLRKSSTRRLSEEKAQEIFLQLGDALKYLRSKDIIHRDLKPQNIMFADKEKTKIKLIDFGLSRFIEEDRLAETLCGSPLYMAPEMIKGQYTVKSDLWSLGVILYQVLYGKPPFMANNHYALINLINTQKPKYSRKIQVSKDAIDLMYRLLQRKIQYRLDWEGFFEHIWMNPPCFEDDINELEDQNDGSDNNYDNNSNSDYSDDEKFVDASDIFITNKKPEKPQEDLELDMNEMLDSDFNKPVDFINSPETNDNSNSSMSPLNLQMSESNHRSKPVQINGSKGSKEQIDVMNGVIPNYFSSRSKNSPLTSAPEYHNEYRGDKAHNPDLSDSLTQVGKAMKSNVVDYISNSFSYLTKYNSPFKSL